MAEEVTEKVEETKNEKPALDAANTSVIYDNHYYKVGGYISDYALTFDPDTKDENGNPVHTINEFVEGTGYADDTGNIYIYRKTPEKNDTVPWFTVEITSDMEPKLVYTSRVSSATQEAFTITNIINLYTNHILTDPVAKEFDNDDMHEEFMRGRSAYTPDIKDEDDFLKKVVKKCLIESGANAKEFEKYSDKPWEIPNLIQTLNGKTKLSPKFFQSWMGYGGWEFTVNVRSGRGCRNPLPHEVVYDSETNDVSVKGKDEDNADQNTIVAVHQFGDTND